MEIIEKWKRKREIKKILNSKDVEKVESVEDFEKDENLENIILSIIMNIELFLLNPQN